MIASVDESVGRIMATLDELGLAENTLVIFSSDNGGVGGYRARRARQGGHHRQRAAQGRQGHAVRRRRARSYIFRWKGKIRAGTTNDTPIIRSICIRRWSNSQVPMRRPIIRSTA